MGTWIRVQKRARLTQRNTASGNAEAAMLLLRAGMQEQHQSPTGEAAQGLSNPPNSLQEEAWREALCLPKMWEDIRSQGRLEDT